MVLDTILDAFMALKWQLFRGNYFIMHISTVGFGNKKKPLLNVSAYASLHLQKKKRGPCSDQSGVGTITTI